jgi:aconitate hydratase
VPLARVLRNGTDADGEAGRFAGRAEPPLETRLPGAVLQDLVACRPWSTSPPHATRLAGPGGEPGRINPRIAVAAVIDHSVQVDGLGKPDAFRFNAEKGFERNAERYSCLRWDEGALDGFKLMRPDTAIVHQVNLARAPRRSLAGRG